MDLMTVVGLALGIGAVYYTLQAGGLVNMIYNFPSLVLVLGGTIASTFLTYPYRILKRVPAAMMLALFPQKRWTAEKYISLLVELAEKAKRNGLDSLQEELPKI